MKSLMIVLSLMMSSLTFAAETQTKCPWMNESREKILKDPVSLKKASTPKAVSQ